MPRPHAPGPIYDNALRHLADTGLNPLCRWLGLDTGSVADVRQRSPVLPGTTLYADLIVNLGEGHFAQVEYVRRPEPDLARRMLHYRGRILHLHPDCTRLTQCLLVLADGTVTDDLDDPHLAAHPLTVIYLRDQDPADLLTHPTLAPLAVLARAAGPVEREHILRKVLAVITTASTAADRRTLLRVAATLAGIHLTADTIERLTEEAAMPFTLDEDTVAGRSIAARAEARGEARGEAQGEIKGRTATLAGLLRRTFGDDPRIDAIAHRLAELPQDKALDAALAATTLDDLDHLDG
jgi:hypothetical protein